MNRIWRGLRILLMLAIGVMFGTAVHNAEAAPIVIGHRGASTATVPENTLSAMKYAAPKANMLEGDIRWTKDSSDADSVGTMIVFHDATLDRTTNCTGYVSARLWTYIRDNCRTDKAKQPVMKLVDWVAWARSTGKPIMFDLKVNMNSAQAKQFWKAAKLAPAGSIVQGTKSLLPGLQLVKRLDAADTSYRLRYGYVTTGEPSVAYVKAVGPYLVIEKDITASRVAYYRSNGLTVYLWTGKTSADYASMTAKKPNGVSVDNARAYAEWAAR